jgi:hypothetical protein
MTDPTASNPTPSVPPVALPTAPTAPPMPPTAAYPPAAPGYPPAGPGYAPAGYPPAATAYTPAPAGARQGLSLTSFILGIAGFLLAFVFGFGLIVGVAAVILGFLGRKREPAAPRWMSLVGIIGGFVGIAVALIVGGLFVVAIVANAVAGDGYANF